MPKKLNLIIADDNRWFRKCISDDLKEYDLNTTETDSNALLQDLLKTHAPDVVLLDIKLSAMDGQNMIRAIKKESSHTKVIVMGEYCNNGLINNCLKRGANYYLPKNFISDGKMLYDAIHNVSVFNWAHNYTLPDKTTYTDVEIEFIQMSNEGKTIKEIANAAGITEKAAERRRQRLYTKTNSRSKADFIRNIIKNGLEYLAKA